MEGFRAGTLNTALPSLGTPPPVAVSFLCPAAQSERYMRPQLSDPLQSPPSAPSDESAEKACRLGPTVIMADPRYIALQTAVLRDGSTFWSLWAGNYWCLLLCVNCSI